MDANQLRAWQTVKEVGRLCRFLIALLFFSALAVMVFLFVIWWML
jgi:hypothetical protein